MSGLKSIEQAIVQSISKNVTAMEYAKFTKNFAKIQGAQLAGYIPSMKTIATWGIPVGAAVVMGNAAQGESETETEE